MEDELRSVHQHMLALGLGALAHANWHANYHSYESDYWSELSVIQAAHAAEILIKARIAEEHPLLIFEHLPKPNKSEGTILELRHLIDFGRTYQYADLPDRLWATTGLRLPNLEMYGSFGRLRNAIQHFTSPNDHDLSQETLEFIFGVIDPFINEFWGLFAIDYNEDHEPYAYFVPGLISRHIHFLVSPDLVKDPEFNEIGVEWPKGDPAYNSEMERRLADAKAAIL